MKKRNLKSKLNLKKKIIASLVARNLIGGNLSDDTIAGANDSLGKQSTCPIETCTCLGDDVPVRL